MITDQFWIFVVSGLLLNLTPGNDMLYVIARSSGGSERASSTERMFPALYFIIARFMLISLSSLYKFSPINTAEVAHLVERQLPKL